MAFSKTTILTGVGIMLLLIARIFFSGGLTSLSQSTHNSQETSIVSNSDVPKNAFLPSTSATKDTTYGSDVPKNETAPSKDGVALGIPPTIEGIGSAIQKSLSPAPQELLSLPSVSSGELSISDHGVSDVVGYFDILAKSQNKLHFDLGRLSAIMARKDYPFPAPGAIVDVYLAGKANEQIIDSDIQVFKDFIHAKIEFEKSIEVNDAGVSINSRAIGMDMITLDLLDKFIAFRSGDISQNAFLDFYGKYKQTMRFHSNQFLVESDALAKNSPPYDALRDAFTFFFGVLRAKAALPIPFGGLVGANVPCTCPATLGMAMTVGVPRPGVFFVAPVVGLFAYWAPFVGNWVLGIAAEAPVPCLQVLPPPAVCTTVPEPQTEGTVIMMGTSL